MFVSKADSTGYLPQTRPSPIRTISTAFLRWLSRRNRARRPGGKQVISLFGRAQGQYLFPGSAENSKKHVLDDRQLIRWWVRVLDPLINEAHHGELGRRGFITVPGYHGAELRQFLPAARDQWKPGHPLQELARVRNVPEYAPTRCLLPRFPDDPKARFMQDLDDEIGLAEDAGALASTLTSPSKRKDGRWKSIHDLDRFWEAMEFRQECSSGRVVGFLWLVTDYETSSNELSQASDDLYSTGASSQAPVSQEHDHTSDQKANSHYSRRRKKRKLTGVIIARSPRVKGASTGGVVQDPANRFDGDGLCITPDGYDQAMQTLLHLDFADLETATRSTSKWIAEIAALCGQHKHTWTLSIHGKAASAETGVLDRRVGQVNDLGGMIRKKKRPLDSATTSQTSPEAQPQEPVKLLGAGLIRKKPKA
ncbi:hypothetical protein AMS68_007152 [Peltaster fructicola]|uniref:histone acetyltransferase n=1 Tax=Peltaster fructicola TaxID=286661 RepID=A0A6H0Y3X8_9PEZI|nr:hypothetical protein AMS68_007152 [Peltaster fructicola]